MVLNVLSERVRKLQVLTLFISQTRFITNGSKGSSEKCNKKRKNGSKISKHSQHQAGIQTQILFLGLVLTLEQVQFSGSGGFDQTDPGLYFWFRCPGFGSVTFAASG